MSVPTKGNLVELYFSIKQQSASIRINQHQSASICINLLQFTSIGIFQNSSVLIYINQHQSASSASCDTNCILFKRQSLSYDISFINGLSENSKSCQSWMLVSTSSL